MTSCAGANAYNNDVRTTSLGVRLAFYVVVAVSIALCEHGVLSMINKQQTFQRDTAGTHAQRRCML